MPRAEVAACIVDDWLDCAEENTSTQAEWEDVIGELGTRMAVLFDLKFGGDDARLSLAQAFRDAADEIEESTGKMIKNDTRRRQRGK